MRIKVDLGDHTVFPLSYTQGAAPQKETEIALSVLLARELDKSVDDSLNLVIDGQSQQLRVSGIYSDITNGGKTAKAVFTDESAPVMWATIAVDLVRTDRVISIADDYAAKFDYAKIAGIDEYIRQTFGVTIRSVEMASYAAIIIGILTTILITLLFMNMLIVKDGYASAVMKAFGFTNQDIRLQYIARSLMILIIGVIVGTLLANTLGERLAGLVISSLGAASFKFVINPLAAYIVSPLLLTIAVFAATFIGTRKAGQINIYQHIKE
jgi:putative ABC transport system permease protein